MDSTAAQVLDHLRKNYVLSEQMETFLRRTNSSKTPQELENFLDSYYFRQTFEVYWGRETRKKNWPGRSPQEALSETVLHTLTNIRMKAQLFLNRGQKERFPFSSDETVAAIDTYAGLLSDYFKQVFSGEDQSEPAS